MSDKWHAVELIRVTKLSFYYHPHFPLSHFIITHISLSFTLSLLSFPPFSFFYFGFSHSRLSFILSLSPIPPLFRCLFVSLKHFHLLGFFFSGHISPFLGFLLLWVCSMPHISPYFILFGFSLVCATTGSGIHRMFKHLGDMLFFFLQCIC